MLAVRGLLAGREVQAVWVAGDWVAGDDALVAALLHADPDPVPITPTGPRWVPSPDTAEGAVAAAYAVLDPNPGPSFDGPGVPVLPPLPPDAVA